jgi:hypothetical protein
VSKCKEGRSKNSNFVSIKNTKIIAKSIKKIHEKLKHNKTDGKNFFSPSAISKYKINRNFKKISLQYLIIQNRTNGLQR